MKVTSEVKIKEASYNIFYRIRIDEISGHRAGPDSLAETTPQPLERRVNGSLQATLRSELQAER